MAAHASVVYPMPTTAKAMASEAGHDDVEDSDDTIEDGPKDSRYTVHDGHETVAYGAEHTLDLFIARQHVLLRCGRKRERQE